MNVPYFIMPGYTKINIDGQQWNLVSGHGKGGGKNGDLELDKMAAVYSQGDVFFLGHNHQLYCKPIDSLRIDALKHKQIIVHDENPKTDTIRVALDSRVYDNNHNEDGDSISYRWAKVVNYVT